MVLLRPCFHKMPVKYTHRIESKIFTQFSLSDFQMPSVETMCAHSKLGSRNPTSAEFQVSKPIQSQQQKNPLHSFCLNTKRGCSVNTGVFLLLWLECFLPALGCWQSSRSDCRTLPELPLCCLYFAPSLTSPLSDRMQTSSQMLLRNTETRAEICCCDFLKASRRRSQRISGIPGRGRNQLY